MFCSNDKKAGLKEPVIAGLAGPRDHSFNANETLEGIGMLSNKHFTS
jgi:hypothetical protein